jgi:hypothetical protein
VVVRSNTFECEIQGMGEGFGSRLLGQRALRMGECAIRSAAVIEVQGGSGYSRATELSSPHLAIQ